MDAENVKLKEFNDKATEELQRLAESNPQLEQFLADPTLLNRSKRTGFTAVHIELSDDDDDDQDGGNGDGDGDDDGDDDVEPQGASSARRKKRTSRGSRSEEPEMYSSEEN